MPKILKQKLVIWGAGGHARVVADIVHLEGIYEIAGFIDDINPDKQGVLFCGSTILGGQEQLNGLRRSGIVNLILAFGDCAARLNLSRVVREQGFRLVTAVHPRAILASDVIVRAGTVIAAGAVINPGAFLGENVIINTCASVDHECIIQDGVHVSPGVRLGGKVSVGRGTWIGIGATVKDHVSIGNGVIIGAGAVVVNDIPEKVIAYGVPAKVIRKVIEA